MKDRIQNIVGQNARKETGGSPLKTSHGKLALLAFILLAAALLFLPMRAGVEDQLILQPGMLKMNPGDSYTIRCALASDEQGQKLKFASSDSKVASIGNDGTVYALSSGEAVIYAKASGGAEASMRVSVAGIPMNRLSLNVDEVQIAKGEYSGLIVTYNTDASDTRLQWLSSDESVVQVDGSGRIKGVGGGEAYVSVLAPNGRSASARVFVDVEGTAVHISPNGLTLGVGARVPLKTFFLPEDSTDRVRRWVSSNAAVLSVDENGVINACGVGEAYLTVLTEDGLTTGMEVVVEPAPRDIQLDPATATLERGATLPMQLMFLNADGSVDVDNRHLVVWSSSDPSVATVDQNGLVTARRSGSCRIEAASDGMVASCRLNVQVSVQEITLNQSEVYLLRDEAKAPIQLKWVISPVDADDPGVQFTSDNTQVASVSKDGLVSMTGGYGTAVITASAASGARASFTVNVVTALPEEIARESFDAEPDYEADVYYDDALYPEEDIYYGENIYPEEDIYYGENIYPEADLYYEEDLYYEDEFYPDEAYPGDEFYPDEAEIEVGADFFNEFADVQAAVGSVG